MPLVVRSDGVITPQPPGPPVSLGPVPLGLSYVDPDGVTWPLGYTSGSGVYATACAGISGPQPSLTAVNLVGGGAIPQFYRTATRPIVVGVFVEADTQDAFMGLLDRWARALWNERHGDPAPGTLVVERPDGTARLIQVICTDGADQTDDAAGKSGLTWTTYSLTFQALDPLWADATPNVLEFKVYTAAGVPPMPPVDLAPQSLLGETLVTNEGDADTYPVWTIAGPGTPIVENLTTGRQFSLDALTAGEVITVDTRPTLVSAVDQDGNDAWPRLVASSPRDLWPLVPGPNLLNLNLSGSGDGSMITLTYTRRWLRA
jgi:hypothetical protein